MSLYGTSSYSRSNGMPHSLAMMACIFYMWRLFHSVSAASLLADIEDSPSFEQVCSLSSSNMSMSHVFQRVDDSMIWCKVDHVAVPLWLVGLVFYIMRWASESHRVWYDHMAQACARVSLHPCLVQAFPAVSYSYKLFVLRRRTCPLPKASGRAGIGVRADR